MEFLDQMTKESLEIQYILNKINTRSPYGKIYKDKIRPYLPGEEKDLKEELEKVEIYMKYAQNKEFTRNINNILCHTKDLRQSTKKANSQGILTEIELFEIKQFLFLIRELEQLP